MCSLKKKVLFFKENKEQCNTLQLRKFLTLRFMGCFKLSLLLSLGEGEAQINAESILIKKKCYHHYAKVRVFLCYGSTCPQSDYL